MFKTLSIIVASCTLTYCATQMDYKKFSASFKSADTIPYIDSHISKIDIETIEEQPKPERESADIKSVQAGDYLSSRYAQRMHDWKNANLFIDRLYSNTEVTDDIQQRAMVLAMGAGDAKKALKFAKETEGQDNQSTIATLFLIIDAVKNDDYARANTLYEALQYDGTVKFIGPFLKGWIDAGLGQSNIKSLNENTIQLYHSILISDYLKDHIEVEKMIDYALNVEDITLNEKLRIADLYGHIGASDKAIAIYKEGLKTQPDLKILEEKISAIEKGEAEPLFDTITNASHGMAKAFHDISSILYTESNDDSARVFAHAALYLNPNLIETKFLIAEINVRHKQYNTALEYYKSIPKENEHYLQAQYEIVDIYDETNRLNEAFKLLDSLSNNQTDVDTLMKIGDLYRHQEKYKDALKAYQKAYDVLGDTVPDEYWHLHYVLGIAYEQTDNWPKAEKHLKASLAMRPDQPFVLNYLGYAWADQNIHLEEAQEMIQRAVNLKPNDGYITDSLGWIMYRTGDLVNATRVMERAVQLLPYDPTVNDHLGDVYWQVGRHREARFQWKRAINHSKDPEQIKAIEEKLANGLEPLSP